MARSARKLKPLLVILGLLTATLALLVAWVAWPPAATPLAPHWGSTACHQLRVGDVDRSFCATFPPESSGPFDLIVDFHGFGLKPELGRPFLGWDRIAREHAAIVVYPYGEPVDGSLRTALLTRIMGGSWSLGTKGPWYPESDDVQFLATLLPALRRVAPVRRVLVSGLSAGAAFAQYAGAVRPDLMDMVVAVAGYLPQEVAPKAPVPLMIVQGTADTAVPVAGLPDLVPPFEETVAKWVRINGCHDSRETVVDRDADDGTVLHDRVYACTAAPLEVLLVEGAGHWWLGWQTEPGRRTYLWNAFERFILRDRNGWTSRELNVPDRAYEALARLPVRS